jgi:hypothetical protein
LLRKNKTKKQRLPTIDEFLMFIPNRAELEWSTNKDGLIEIKMEKFNSNIGKSFCKVIKKENFFTANMDKLGSIVWKNCDGKKNVKQILKILEKEFPKEENLDQRLILFLQQMNSLRYINL